LANAILIKLLSSGIEKVKGINFTIPRKSETTDLLKQRVQNQQFLTRS
jgi:hypothetical protein